MSFVNNAAYPQNVTVQPSISKPDHLSAMRDGSIYLPNGTQIHTRIQFNTSLASKHNITYHNTIENLKMRGQEAEQNLQKLFKVSKITTSKVAINPVLKLLRSKLAHLTINDFQNKQDTLLHTLQRLQKLGKTFARSVKNTINAATLKTRPFQKN